MLADRDYRPVGLSAGLAAPARKASGRIKKPLVLPFLDYGTPQRMRELCSEEVRLDRRLAAGWRGMHDAAETATSTVPVATSAVTTRPCWCSISTCTVTRALKRSP
jgi:hypothetical protein